MSKVIRVRRNTIANIPTLQLAEPFWATDTNTLYVGDGSTNHKAVPDPTPTTLASLGLDADLATLSVPANTTVSAFAKTILDDADAAAVKATLGISAVETPYVYPEDYGATGDGTTDDYAALQACFDAVMDATYSPTILFKSAKYAFGTGLVIDFAQGMRLQGCGGFWTPSDAGFAGNVTILSYTGSGVALTIDASTNNATGLIMEQFYLKGTSSATGGIYINTASGIVLRDMSVGKFTKTNAYGIKSVAAQVNTFSNIGLVDNYYGMSFLGAANVRNSIYDCMYHSNVAADFYDTGSFQTVFYNPVFQNSLTNAIFINMASGAGVAQGMTLYEPYFEGCASTNDAYVIEIIGDASAAANWYKGFSIHGGSYSGAGAHDLGFVRARYTTRSTFDNIQYNTLTPAPVYTIDPAVNSAVTFYRLDPAFTDDLIEDGSNNAAYWTKHYSDGRVALSQYDTGQAAQLLQLKHAAEAGPFIDFQGTVAANATKNISSWTNATIKGFVKCELNGVASWVAVYDAPTS